MKRDSKEDKDRDIPNIKNACKYPQNNENDIV